MSDGSVVPFLLCDDDVWLPLWAVSPEMEGEQFAGETLVDEPSGSGPYAGHFLRGRDVEKVGGLRQFVQALRQRAFAERPK